jgi:hypothetical protein
MCSFEQYLKREASVFAAGPPHSGEAARILLFPDLVLLLFLRGRKKKKNMSKKKNPCRSAGRVAGANCCV